MKINLGLMFLVLMVVAVCAWVFSQDIEAYSNQDRSRMKKLSARAKTIASSLPGLIERAKTGTDDQKKERMKVVRDKQRELLDIKREVRGIEIKYMLSSPNGPANTTKNLQEQYKMMSEEVNEAIRSKNLEKMKLLDESLYELSRKIDETVNVDRRTDFTKKTITRIKSFTASADTPDESRSASSSFQNDKSGYRYHSGTLYSKQGWSSKVRAWGQWYQLDLGKETVVRGVTTKGRADSDQWVESFHVLAKRQNGNWFWVDDKKLFQGNKDRNTSVDSFFSRSIKARYVRIYPKGWRNHMSMRSDVLIEKKYSENISTMESNLQKLLAAVDIDRKTLTTMMSTKRSISAGRMNGMQTVFGNIDSMISPVKNMIKPIKEFINILRKIFDVKKAYDATKSRVEKIISDIKSLEKIKDGAQRALDEVKNLF